MSTPLKGRSQLSAMSSPLKYPSEMDENANPNAQASVGVPSNKASAGADTQQALQSQGNTQEHIRLIKVSSPLPYPSSSLGVSTQRSQLRSELFANSQSTPRASRRNDLEYNANGDRLYSQNHSQLAEETVELPEGSVADPAATKTFVWGTQIDPFESLEKFKDFLINFTVAHRKMFEGLSASDLTDNDRRPYYPRILEQHLQDGNYILNLDFQNLRAYPPAAELYQQAVSYPQEMLLSVMDFCVTQVFQDMFANYENVENIIFKVRPFGLSQTVNLRELDPKDIDKLVSIKGFVIRVSNPIPELKIGFFECNRCAASKTVPVDNGRLAEPGRCEACEMGSFQMVYARSQYYDKQIIRLQETPDSVPDGQTPHNVSLVAYDELVDIMKPGDRVEVTGIFKAMPARVNPKQRVTRAVFKTYIDVLHVTGTEKKRMGTMFEGQLKDEEIRIEHMLSEKLSTLPAETMEKIYQISREPGLFDKLAQSVAPSIFGHLDAKKSVLLQLFGGTTKEYEKSQSTKSRGNIHVLLCGDPATAKSQILMYVHRLAPRGIYTSGKGSSAVGLTASVKRDPETKQLVLESGALVLSDGGICCIDEFDKMSDATRSVLHEAMEQQTVSVAKAGIITTLNARASILAAANPIHSKWNRNFSVVKNLNLPPTLLSRFDIVYLMLDEIEETYDTHLAKHILSLYLDPKAQVAQAQESIPLDMETFAAYISYARQNIRPIMDNDCINLIAEEYVQIRKMGAMSATTRQLEAIIRLSEAHAKMRLSKRVEKSDVEEAVRIIYAALRLSAIDPRTGLLDPGLLTTGVSARERKESQNLRRALKELLERKSRAHGPLKVDFIATNDVLQEMRQASSVSITLEEFDKALEEVVNQVPRASLKNGTIHFD